MPKHSNTSAAFEKSYRNLNSEQKRAVDAIEGPVMVVAGPGTGKTTILTLRIANILRLTDVPPSGILAITYTDAGVKAMRIKLREIIGNRAHEVAVHTFHSFASAMISEYPDHFLHLQGFRNMTDIDQETLLRKIIAEPIFRSLRPIGRPDAYIATIIKSIENAKREALRPEEVRNFASAEMKRIENDPASISSRGASKGKIKAEAQDDIEKCQRTILFADVYERYEKEKQTAKRMDFSDLIMELLSAFHKDELFLRLIQERFLYIHVDEHQDTNDAQNLILKFIAEFFDTPNVFIVGDEKQAIYRFQGASVENFLDLQKRWKNMKLIRLDTNYRSHQSIIDAGFSMIEHNYEGDEHADLRVRLKSGGAKKSRPLTVAQAENTPALELHLVKELKAIVEKEPNATIAIITRRNRDLERILRLLESHRIAVSSQRSVDIFHHPIGAVFFDLLEFFADPTRLDSLGLTIASGLWQKQFGEGIVLIRALRSGEVSGLEKSLPLLARLRRLMLEDGAVGFLIHAAELSGFEALVARDPVHMQVWRGIITLAETLAREGNIQSPSDLISALLAYRQSAEAKTVKVAVGTADLPIQAMTAHGSKGLEFDYVFLPYATEEAWIGRSRGASFVLPKKRSDESDIRDVRRLFYVALTRARKHAVIMSALEESDGKALSPLRFIAELDEKSGDGEIRQQKNIEHISLARISVESVMPHGSVFNDETAYASKMVALAKDVLLNSGVSVTALNHFIDCPSKFLYLSIVKLPQAPSASAEKGNAMHEAIASVWMKKDHSKAMIEESIIEAVTKYAEASLLSVNDKRSIKEELLANSPAVAAALEGHFAQSGHVTVERWVKSVFNGSFADQSITMPIHGKLDAIVETSGDVLVFDYKTRQGMTPAEIKGETKNSTGDYFRQLIFYQLLMESDRRWSGRKIIPALVFVSPDKKGRCPIVSVPIEEKDVDAVKKNLQAIIDSVWSGKIITDRCDDQNCKWCALRRMMGAL